MGSGIGGNGEFLTGVASGSERKLGVSDARFLLRGIDIGSEAWRVDLIEE
jgi:hypothetical protein